MAKGTRGGKRVGSLSVAERNLVKATNRLKKSYQDNNPQVGMNALRSRNQAVYDVEEELYSKAQNQLDNGTAVVITKNYIDTRLNGLIDKGVSKRLTRTIRKAVVDSLKNGNAVNQQYAQRMIRQGTNTTQWQAELNRLRRQALMLDKHFS